MNIRPRSDAEKVREALRDTLAGWPIGSGYYTTQVGVDEAWEMADAVLAALDLPARDARVREQALRDAADTSTSSASSPVTVP